MLFGLYFPGGTFLTLQSQAFRDSSVRLGTVHPDPICSGLQGIAHCHTCVVQLSLSGTSNSIWDETGPGV